MRTHQPVAVFLSLLASALAQSPTHAVATVNDVRSHGQVGDNYLSLNEVILLHNRQLQLGQLSVAEQNQIFGATDIAMAEMDYALVPYLRLERDLEPVNNLPHGFVIRGTDSMGLERVPVIDIGNTLGFLGDSDFCDFRNIILRGGAVAVRIAQRNAVSGSTFEKAYFENQTVAAVQIYLVEDAGYTRFVFENSTFTNVPMAVQIDDLTNGRTGTVQMRGCSFQSCNDGVLVNLGGGGGSYTLTFERSTFTSMARAITVRRPSAAADRGVILDLIDLYSRQLVDAVTVEGHPTALLDSAVRMVDLQGSGSALRLGGPGTNSRLLMHDSRLAGAVVLAGRTQMEIDNLRQTGGSLTISAAAGTALTMRQVGLSGVAFSLAGGVGVTMDAGRLEGGSASGSASSPVTITNSYVSNVSLGNNVVVNNSLPAPQLGATYVRRQQMPLGQTVDLDHDLPTGFFGIWIWGLGVDLPTVQSGVRLYIDPNTLFVLPGTWRGQGRVPFPVPVIRALHDRDLVYQMIVGKDAGVRGPLMQAPQGGRVILR